MSSEKKGFRVAARALRQFGAELITSDDIALNELIKNAFDARSPRVQINIYAPADPGSVLVIAEELETKTFKHREDALDRLDKCLADELDTKARKEINGRFKDASKTQALLAQCVRDFLDQDFFIEIVDRGCGMAKDDLENNFLVIGTPNKWVTKNAQSSASPILLGEKGIGRLSMMRLGRFAQVVSATAEEANWNVIQFDWSEFDDPTLGIEDIDVRVGVHGKKTNKEHGTAIRISGLDSYWTHDKAMQFIDTYLRRLQDPFTDSTLPYPVDVFFNGERLPIPGIPPWLVSAAQFRAEMHFNPNAEGSEVMLSRRIRWHNNSSDELRDWSAQTLLNLLNVPHKVLQQLGPLNVICLWYNRQQLISNNVDRSQKQILDELNLWCGGFAVYRDGFRIGQTGGMQDDWLQMDQKALRAKGFTFNRFQTVGCVQISSRNNPKLIDAANRESLVSCPEYETLREMLGRIVVDDLRSHIGAVKELEVRKAISEESTEQSLRKSEKDLARTIRTVSEISKAIPVPQRKRLDEVKTVLTEQAENVKTLRRALELARETRMEILELAGIGLVVEIVIHELVRLTERTSKLLSELEEDSSTTPKVERIIETLRLQIRATNKRMRTVDVMSPSGRHRKEKFDLITFIQSIVDGYASKLKTGEITLSFLVDGKKASGRVEVEMVQGLIGQVLENLLTNSIYWVQQGTWEEDAERTIWIEYDSVAKTVSVTDNGPGIDPQNAKDLFRPYFTTRRKGKGLGLFIAAELAAYHGAKLYLDESPNEDGRLRTFTLELPREH